MTVQGSRHIPAAVRRDVWNRDGGRCAFVGTSGRCAETGFLELHHVVPYAAGGAATTENIQVRCAAHNQYEAEQSFRDGESLFVRDTAASFGARNSARTELTSPDARVTTIGTTPRWHLLAICDGRVKITRNSDYRLPPITNRE